MDLNAYARALHLAKFEQGKSMTPEEVSKVVGPEFAENVENPPESVENLTEEMKKEAARIAADLVRRDRGALFALRRFAGRGSRSASILVREIETAHPKARTAKAAGELSRSTVRVAVLAIAELNRARRRAADFLAEETEEKTEDAPETKTAAAGAPLALKTNELLTLLATGYDKGMDGADLAETAVELSRIFRIVGAMSTDGIVEFSEILNHRLNLGLRREL